MLDAKRGDDVGARFNVEPRLGQLFLSFPFVGDCGLECDSA